MTIKDNLRGTILLIDHDDGRAGMRALALLREGWIADAVNNHGAAAIYAEQHRVDALVLSGVDSHRLAFMRDVREGQVKGLKPDTRLVALTSSDTTTVAAYQFGADLCLPPDGSSLVLDAALRSLTDRQHRDRTQVLQIGAVRVDQGARAVTVDGVQIPLAPKEFGVIQALAVAGGQVVNSDDLAQAVWGDTMSRGGSLRSQAVRINRKAQQAGVGRLIENRRGTWKLHNPTLER